MTEYSEIICDYFMVQQSDDRLTDEMDENPAKFMRKMALYMKSAIPLFKRPPQVKIWLKREREPEYEDAEMVLEETVSAGSAMQGLEGYDMVSVGVLTEDEIGRVVYTPVKVSYDAETGEITPSETLYTGADVQIDYYKDGRFANDLTDRMKEILGLCVQYVWERRFNNDFLARTPKIKDNSFNIGSESNWVAKGTERLNALWGQLNSEMISFEQGLAALEKVPGTRKIQMPTI